MPASLAGGLGREPLVALPHGPAPGRATAKTASAKFHMAVVDVMGYFGYISSAVRPKTSSLRCAMSTILTGTDRARLS